MWRCLFFIYLFLNWCWERTKLSGGNIALLFRLHFLCRCWMIFSVTKLSIKLLFSQFWQSSFFLLFHLKQKNKWEERSLTPGFVACGQIGFLGLSFSAIFGKSSFLEICNFAFSSARLSQLCDWKNKESQFHRGRNVLKQETWPEYFFTPYITQDRQLWFQIKRTIQNPRRVAQNKNWTLYSVQHPFLLISRVV